MVGGGGVCRLKNLTVLPRHSHRYPGIQGDSKSRAAQWSATQFALDSPQHSRLFGRGLGAAPTYAGRAGGPPGAAPTCTGRAGRPPGSGGIGAGGSGTRLAGTGKPHGYSPAPLGDIGVLVPNPAVHAPPLAQCLSPVRYRLEAALVVQALRLEPALVACSLSRWW
jgi:hypothetical protein